MINNEICVGNCRGSIKNILWQNSVIDVACQKKEIIDRSVIVMADLDSDSILNGILNILMVISITRLQTSSSSSGTVKILRRNVEKTITHFIIYNFLRFTGGHNHSLDGSRNS